MREYERYDAGIPVRIVHAGRKYKYIIENISLGGMACMGDHEILVSEVIDIQILLLKPVYISKGKVVWCKAVGDHYEIGVEHIGEKGKDRLDMIEQISHIEHYRADIKAAEGRELTGEQAAKEWIATHG